MRHVWHDFGACQHAGHWRESTSQCESTAQLPATPPTSSKGCWRRQMLSSLPCFQATLHFVLALTSCSLTQYPPKSWHSFGRATSCLRVIPATAAKSAGLLLVLSCRLVMLFCTMQLPTMNHPSPFAVADSNGLSRSMAMLQALCPDASMFPMIQRSKWPSGGLQVKPWPSCRLMPSCAVSFTMMAMEAFSPPCYPATCATTWPEDVAGKKTAAAMLMHAHDAPRSVSLLYACSMIVACMYSCSIVHGMHA